MLKNYLLVALRNLKYRKLYSVITILGLSLGICVSLLIGIYVYNELKINSIIHDVSSEYLVESNWKSKDMGVPITTMAPLGPALKANYPGLVRNYYRFHGEAGDFKVGNKMFRKLFQAGDSTFFEMFGFELLHGDAATALNAPNKAVLMEATALAFFGSTDVVGRTFELLTPSNKGQVIFKVSGVLKTLPYNSVTNVFNNSDYGVIIPINDNVKYFLWEGADRSWDNKYLPLYLELQKGVKTKDVEAAADELIRRNTVDPIKSNLTVDLRALRSYHLHEKDEARGKLLHSLLYICIAILCISVINFVNISVSKSFYRLREIGMRRCLGGRRGSIAFQFLIESIVVTFFSALIGIGLYFLLQGKFSEVVGQSSVSIFSFGFSGLLILLLFVLVVGVIAGAYPAVMLSRVDMLNSLKGNLDERLGNRPVNNILTFVQFVMAIFLIISTFVVQKQANFFFNKDLGYDKGNLLVISSVPRDWTLDGVKRNERLRDLMGGLKSVSAASLSFEIPDSKFGSFQDLSVEAGKAGNSLSIGTLKVDEKYIDTYGLKMKAGSFFKGSELKDHPRTVVLNETAVNQLGLGNPIGKKVFVKGWDSTFTVEGIVKDFNFASLRQSIPPLLFMHVRDFNTYRYLTVKLNNSDIQRSVQEIESEWNRIYPGQNFEYQFFDDILNKLYQSELQLKKASSLAIFVVILIILAGTFGMVSMNLFKRTKEIAVRYVLGANMWRIFFMVSTDYVIILGLATIVGWSSSFYLLKNWLDNYSYRVGMPLIAYPVATVILLLLIFMIIGMVFFRLLRDKPIKSLNKE